MSDHKNIFTVNYEELTSDTKSTMQNVANFLGIEFNEKFTYPTMNSKETVVSTSSKDTTKVFQQNLDWKESLTITEILSIQLAPIVSTVLKYYKYTKARLSS